MNTQLMLQLLPRRLCWGGEFLREALWLLPSVMRLVVGYMLN